MESLTIKQEETRKRDRVRIVNLSAGQHNEGEIVGKTKENLIKVRIENGKVARRKNRNLKKQR